MYKLKTPLKSRASGVESTLNFQYKSTIKFCHNFIDHLIPNIVVKQFANKRLLHLMGKRFVESDYISRKNNSLNFHFTEKRK